MITVALFQLAGSLFLLNLAVAMLAAIAVTGILALIEISR